MNDNNFSLAPQTLTEAMEYAEIISKSSICPKAMQNKPGDVLVAVQMGSECGMKPLQAIQNIAVINGRPTVWGDAMLALVRSSGLLKQISETVTDDGAIATCAVIRKGDPQAVSRSFSLDDAKKAGLLGKQGPWQQYTSRMLQLRARSFALRDVFPDVLAGLYMREEAMDIPQERDVTPVADLQAALTKQAPAPAPTPPADAYISTVADAEEFLSEIAMADNQEKMKAIASALKACTFENDDDHSRLQNAWVIRRDFLKKAGEENE
jgi:hypothetical protein